LERPLERVWGDLREGLRGFLLRSVFLVRGVGVWVDSRTVAFAPTAARAPVWTVGSSSSGDGSSGPVSLLELEGV
jgi:hypothetical protein